MTPRILVIEDNPKWYEFFKRTLEKMGYEVDVAKERTAAELLLQRVNYQLIVLDICLDGDVYDANCQEFYETLQADHGDIPIIVTSGWDLRATEWHEIFQSQPAGFFHKRDSKIADLRATVKKLVPAVSFKAAASFDNGRALIIGVGEYLHPRFENLPATVLDARELGNVLHDPSRCAYPPGNVEILTGGTATRHNIRLALLTLGQRSTEDSTVLIYFSGHGCRVMENDNWQTYLCPREADPDRLADTAISGQEFSQLLGDIPAAKMVIFLDTCHAGGSLQLKGEADGEVWRRNIPASYLRALSEGSGRVIIASSKEKQLSYDRPQEDYSVFTWHLIEGLRGKAIHHNERYVRILDLFNHVNEQVRREQPGQQPVLEAKSLDDNFPIALGPQA